MRTISADLRYVNWRRPGAAASAVRTSLGTGLSAWCQAQFIPAILTASMHSYWLDLLVAGAFCEKWKILILLINMVARDRPISEANQDSEAAPRVRIDSKSILIHRTTDTRTVRYKRWTRAAWNACPCRLRRRWFVSDIDTRAHLWPYFSRAFRFRQRKNRNQRKLAGNIQRVRTFTAVPQ